MKHYEYDTVTVYSMFQKEHGYSRLIRGRIPSTLVHDDAGIVCFLYRVVSCHEPSIHHPAVTPIAVLTLGKFNSPSSAIHEFDIISLSFKFQPQFVAPHAEQLIGGLDWLNTEDYYK